MKRWVQWAASLYPARWRARYGREFDSLLQDAEPRPGDVWDTMRSALEMQMRMGNMLRFLVAAALAGALLEMTISPRLPHEYVAKGEIRVTAASDDFEDQWRTVQAEVLSRGSLASLILRSDLDLYRGERQRRPLEDVVQNMRRHLGISRVPESGKIEGYEVTYSYGDSLAAGKVAAEIVDGLVAKQHELSSASRLSVSRLPAPPRDGPRPYRWVAVVCGLIGGPILSLAVWWLWRTPRRWKLLMAAYAVAGGVLAAAILAGLFYSHTLHYLMPNYVSSTTFRFAGNTRAVEQKLADRDILWSVALIPALDLYRDERARRPMKKVLDHMQRDLRIEKSSPHIFTVSFAYDDPFKAQAALRCLVSRINSDLVVDRELTPGGLAKFAADHHDQKPERTPTPQVFAAMYMDGLSAATSGRAPEPWFWDYSPHMPAVQGSGDQLTIIDAASLPELNVLGLGPDHVVMAGVLLGFIAGAILLRGAVL
jgi:hypothetical protein